MCYTSSTSDKNVETVTISLERYTELLKQIQNLTAGIAEIAKNEITVYGSFYSYSGHLMTSSTKFFTKDEFESAMVQKNKELVELVESWKKKSFWKRVFKK